MRREGPNLGSQAGIDQGQRGGAVLEEVHPWATCPGGYVGPW